MTKPDVTLEDILRELWITDPNWVSYEEVAPKALEAIYTLVEGVIGEDEEVSAPPNYKSTIHDVEKHAQNELRAEQRKRLNKVISGGNHGG